MEKKGNESLLDRKTIGYFAAGKIASLSVLPTLDWAAEVAKREDVAVVSGFHSKLEREVLDFLLRGNCGIIYILARSMYKIIPTRYREAFDVGRILFIAPYKTKSATSSRILCLGCNKHAAKLADELVFSFLTPASSLYPLSLTTKPTLLL